MAATRGANDFWNSRAVQSKRSSSSRFSAASLRGLIGHQTAPAREIPKTHVNDVGSLADRIATDCPGATPHRARASATLREVSRTSRVGQGVPVRGQARRLGPERGPLVEVVDQPHPVLALDRDQRCTVSCGSTTSPNARSAPSSSRCPNAWQPLAKPARRGFCWSSEYAAYAWSSPVCL